MLRQKRIELTLDKKVELIKSSEGKSHRQLADLYGIGRTQVGSILKRRTEFLTAFEENTEPSRKRLKCGIQYPDIDKLMWEWFQHARSLNITLSGPLLQERARQFAVLLGHADFKGSSGWLDSFRYRHNIMSSAICNWKEKLTDICDGYDPRDVWNVGEMGVMFRALPDRELRGKRLKDHLTVSLACNMAGEFDTPLVIGKAARPNAFHKLSHDQLPVTWHNNRRAWMTSSIFGKWLRLFNSRMRVCGRNVLLFVESTLCHTHVTEPLSHVKVIFLPAHAPSALQPLDQGIFQNVRQHYRERLLRRLVTDVGACSSIAEVIKSTNVLDAVQLISSAVKDVRPSLVTRCFARAGFPIFIDTLDDPEDDIPLAKLLLQVCHLLSLPDPITDPNDYMAIDSDIPVRETLCADWEESLVRDFVYERNCSVPEEMDGDEDDYDSETDLKSDDDISIAEAIKLTSKVKTFCIQQSFDIWQSLANIEDELKAHMIQDNGSYKQTVLISHFKKKTKHVR